MTEDLRIGCQFFHGDKGIIEAGEFIRELAATFEVMELAHDPWRAVQLALELEREGMVVVTFPQTVPRLVPMSERLHRAVIEHRIVHPNDPELNLHVANAIVKDGPRGWRLDKPSRSALIDGVIALGMAVEAAEQRPAPVQLLGWL